MRKRTEISLCESEKRYQQLYDEAPIGYHQYDQEGRITQVNKTMLGMMGYTANEMLGHNTWEFVEEGIARKMVEKKYLASFHLVKHSSELFYGKMDRDFQP